jgi:hypothetical protein
MIKRNWSKNMLALGTTVTLFYLFGCSAEQQRPVAVPPIGMVPPERPGMASIQPSRTATLIYVADHFNNKINIYTPTLGQAAPPMSGIDVPAGVAIDASGNLYVTNEREKKVRAYHPGKRTPFRIISVGLIQPTFLVLGNDGTLYVSDPDPGSGNVIEYSRGSNTPTLVAKLPPTNGKQDPEGLALDAGNNLYVAYNDNYIAHGTLYGRVQKFKPGATTGTDLGIRVQTVGGIAFDKLGNMILTDQVAPAVLVFPPGSSTPSKTVNLGFSDPFGVAFNKAQTHLYLTDGFGNAIYEIAYPQWTALNKISVTNQPWGVAVSPRAAQ